MLNLASQQALSESTTALLASAATMDESALGALGADLGGMAAVLAGQAHLRRVFTETTIAPEDKAGMAARLLDGKVGAKASAIVQETIRHRWSSGSDLVEGLRRLSRTAMFLRAERAGDLDDVEDQLFRFGRIVDATPELSVILDDPGTPPVQRAELVSRLLSERAHPLTVELLTSLARNPGGRSFSHGISELVSQAAQRRDKVVAVVQSAIALSGEQHARLVAVLQRIYARDVVTHVVVDPAVGGGLRIRVGDEVIDGSVAGKLSTVRQRLAR